MTGPARRWAVLPAAGRGERFGAATPKQYLKVHGRAVLSWSMGALLAERSICGIVVAVAAGDRRFARLPEARDARVVSCIGGARRELSVAHALERLAGDARDSDLVLVHDAARPCLHRDDLRRLIERAGRDPAGGLLAVPVGDTLKRGVQGNRVGDTVPREGLWRALTPQLFRYGLLRRALMLCLTHGRAVTDEASAVEALGLRPLLVAGRADNIKVTAAGGPAARGGRPRRETLGRRWAMRIGHGYDVHAFGPGAFVTLGGVRVPHDRGVVAHSDGDVVLHALCDALLGALGEGDIGQHFPDSDPQWQGASSRLFLRHCASLLAARGWRLVNADLTLLAEAPRLGGHRTAMRGNIATDLGVDIGRINLKATTCEGLGALGRAEGLACHAVVLLKRADGAGSAG